MEDADDEVGGKFVVDDRCDDQGKEFATLICKELNRTEIPSLARASIRSGKVFANNWIDGSVHIEYGSVHIDVKCTIHRLDIAFSIQWDGSIQLKCAQSDDIGLDGTELPSLKITGAKFIMQQIYMEMTTVIVTVLKKLPATLGPLEHSIGQEIKALTVASAALSWLQPHMCKTSVLLYQTAFHKLQSLLYYASKLLAPAKLHSCASPALFQLLHVLRGTLCFINTAAHYEREASAQLDTIKNNASARQAAQLRPLLRAVIFGLGTDAVNIHLHDFLLAYTASTQAIMFALEKEKGELATISRGESRLLRQQPAMSWSMDHVKPHNLTLNDDGVLGLQRECDLEILASKIREAASICSLDDRRTRVSTDLDSISTNLKSLEGFLERVRKMERGRDDVTYGDDDLFLNLSIDDVKPLESLHKVDGVEVKKVQWQGEEFALKQFQSDVFVYLTRETHMYGNLITHPNITQVFCLMEDEKKQERAMLMELMEVTLEKLVKEQNLSLPEKVSIMLQIAKAMEYIHNKGIIHRDLKPTNILYKLCMPTSQGPGWQRTFQIKVADFNISKLNLGTNLTERQGTEIFRAPEVLNQEEDRPKYSYPADVYSFAMVSYQILSGTPPFEVTKVTNSLYDAIMHHNRRPNLSYVRGPRYLKHCLQAWWHAKPEKRPCFSEICRTLRHLTAALLRCQYPLDELLFLQWPWKQWNLAHNCTNAGMCHWAVSQASWKEELGYPSAHTTVIDIPYELQTMKMLMESHEDVTQGLNQTVDSDGNAIFVGEESNWGKPNVLYSIADQLDDLHDGAMFYLKSVTLGTYVSVAPGDGTRVGANGKTPEKFKMWRHRDAFYSFQDTAHQWHYCRDKIFSIQALSSKRYLSNHMIKEATIVTATATFPGEKEKFAITRDGDKVHIRSIFTGKYLQAVPKSSKTFWSIFGKVKDESVLTSDYPSKGEPSWNENDATFEITVLTAEKALKK